MRNACSTQSTYSAGVSSPIMSERPRISVLRLRQLSIAPESLTGRLSRVASWRGRSRAQRRADRARHRDALRARTTRCRARRSAATRTRRRTATRSTTSRARSRSSASTVYRGSVGTLVARNRPAGRARRSGSARTATRTATAAVRRHAGRRHGARGLPAERGARARPAAAADLVPRGGGLGLRPDAAREPDHAAARDRGGAAGDVPRDRRRAQLLGARRGGGLRARALARVRPRPRRPRRLDRDAHRAGARPPGHRQPDRDRQRDRRLRPRRRRRPRAAATTRARRRWTSGSTRRRVLAETVLELERLARGGGQRHRRHRRRDRGRPGADQRDRRARPLLARHPRPGRGARSAASRATIAAFAARRRRAARHDGASYAQRQTLPATPLDARIVARARGGGGRDRRAVDDDASGAAHDTMCVAERVPSAMVFVPCKDGISHQPRGGRDPADAALAAEIILERDRGAGVSRAALRRPAARAERRDERTTTAAPGGENARPTSGVPTRIAATRRRR